MKYIKSYILFVLMVFALTGCNKYDDLKDDVNDLKDRVTLIEQQVKLLNDNLAVIGYILNPQNKTVSKVETVKENGEAIKYVITLSDDTQMVLTIGKPGTINEPVITIGEDGKWYINGVSTGIVAVGQDGKNGEGFPEFRVEKGNWQVRFGDGAWANVPGGEGIANGSLGDQIFESAAVSQDGMNFVVTLKDGTIHTLPIVASLSCVIDRSGLALDADNFLVIEKDSRVEIPVKIEGENPQVTYPQGWRAALNKLDNVDGNGNNYQLLIYAPAAKTKALTRASADNTADVTVQVQKGSFWAVDKIKVKNPKDYSNNFIKYGDGLAIAIGGLDITQEAYGAGTEIIEDTPITEGGVYFVSTNNVTLTYDLGTTGVTNLIIIPTTADVTTINLVVSKQIYFTGTIACQNVNLNHQVANQYPLRGNKNGVKVVFDKCKFMNLLTGKGIIMPNSTSTANIAYFEITKSDIRFDNPGANTYLINNMNCDELVFNQNIVYYSKVVPQSSLAYTGAVSGGEVNNGHFTQFKVYGANAYTLSKLVMNNNTFVDVEVNGTSGYLGFIWAIELKEVEMSNNLNWLSYPATKFSATGGLQNTIPMIRINGSPVKPIITGAGADNYAYNGNPEATDIKFTATNATITTGSLTVTEAEFFDAANSATFDKTNGIFTPKSEYSQYGAQR